VLQIRGSARGWTVRRKRNQPFSPSYCKVSNFGVEVKFSYFFPNLKQISSATARLNPIQTPSRSQNIQSFFFLNKKIAIRLLMCCFAVEMGNRERDVLKLSVDWEAFTRPCFRLGKMSGRWQLEDDRVSMSFTSRVFWISA
jgi:hypothetical protein